jgi:2-polyprenyl-3-methyl-5-hydroxy-6-metoxy-1,4-benzoquinol methylase
MSESDQTRWDAKYAGCQPADRLQPDEWLTTCLASVEPGRALEPACGLGQNAVWLAKAGWEVDAVDVSPLALDTARQLAERHSAEVNWLHADLDYHEPQSGAYDLVIVFRFLDRETLPRTISSAVQTGGRLIYETFTTGQCDRADNHIRNPKYALKPQELPALFPGFAVLEYKEVELENRTVAQLYAERID